MFDTTKKHQALTFREVRQALMEQSDRPIKKVRQTDKASNPSSSPQDPSPLTSLHRPRRLASIDRGEEGR